MMRTHRRDCERTDILVSRPGLALPHWLAPRQAIADGLLLGPQLRPYSRIHATLVICGCQQGTHLQTRLRVLGSRPTIVVPIRDEEARPPADAHVEVRLLGDQDEEETIRVPVGSVAVVRGMKKLVLDPTPGVALAVAVTPAGYATYTSKLAMRLAAVVDRRRQQIAAAGPRLQQGRRF